MYNMSTDELLLIAKALAYAMGDSSMPVSMQISNIGSEVSRAINWKNKGNEKRKVGFCKKPLNSLNCPLRILRTDIG